VNAPDKKPVERTYRCDFTGRLSGAIGIFYKIRATVCATDPEAARLKLYDTYEHITDCTCVEVQP
jgi:hypothetical protein